MRKLHHRSMSTRAAGGSKQLRNVTTRRSRQLELAPWAGPVVLCLLLSCAAPCGGSTAATTPTAAAPSRGGPRPAAPVAAAAHDQKPHPQQAVRSATQGRPRPTVTYTDGVIYRVGLLPAGVSWSSLTLDQKKLVLNSRFYAAGSAGAAFAEDTAACFPARATAARAPERPTATAPAGRPGARGAAVSTPTCGSNGGAPVAFVTSWGRDEQGRAFVNAHYWDAAARAVKEAEVPVRSSAYRIVYATEAVLE